MFETECVQYSYPRCLVKTPKVVFSVAHFLTCCYIKKMMKGRLLFCLSLDTETVNYDHYLRLGGALNFEFSLKKKKKIYIYNWVGH